MEAMGMSTILIIAAVIWYLGSTINNILDASGTVAEKEFNAFKQQQDIRLFKNKVKLHKQVEKIKDATVYSDDEWNKIFDPEEDE